jgi:hypothetical protein
MDVTRIPNPDLSTMVKSMADFARQGATDTLVRQVAERVCLGVASGDYGSEVLALYNFVWGFLRYAADPDANELVKWARHALSTRTGDCLPAGTLLLTSDFEFMPIQKVKIGSKIWGYDKWTTVQDVWEKGERAVHEVRLNNGSSFRATGDHKIYVAICERHSNLMCSCPVSTRVIERIRISDAKDDMVMLTPDRIPFGKTPMEPDMARLDGLYISDGWNEKYRFSISGKDGFPKEQQKRWVEQFCEDRGIATRWHERYITVNDPPLARRMASMGGYSHDKHALSIDLQNDAAAALLDGIMADNGKNTRGNGRTFTSTSRELMLQTRMLYKMHGITCGERYVVHHGGLGDHPVHRLQTRMPRNDGKPTKLLRIKEIIHDVMELPVYDITTEDHYVYLPEADVTVSNCDDQTVLLCAMLESMGRRCALVLGAFDGNPAPSHVFCVVKSPGGSLIVVDPVANTDTGRMLSRLSAWTITPVFPETFGSGPSSGVAGTELPEIPVSIGETLFSVFDYPSKRYTYYTSKSKVPTVSWFRQPAGGPVQSAKKSIFRVPESIAVQLPGDAKRVSEGQIARGVVAIPRGMGIGSLTASGAPPQKRIWPWAISALVIGVLVGRRL